MAVLLRIAGYKLKNGEKKDKKSQLPFLFSFHGKNKLLWNSIIALFSFLFPLFADFIAQGGLL